MNAFGVKSHASFQLEPSRSAGSSSGSGFTFNPNFVALVVAVIAVIAGVWLFSNSRARKPVPPPKLPPAQLAIAQSGELNGRRYEVRGRVEVEIARVGRRELRHEYILHDAGDEALLSQGWMDDAEQWCLLTPFEPEKPLKPRDVAAIDLGESFAIDGSTARATTLFLSRVKFAQGATQSQSGTTLYGLLGKARDQSYALRWTETNIAFYRVTPLSGKTVLAAFK